ncbi:MAG: carboxypeptidase-like regulatory domain-containing protein [Nitrospirae bacterium]|nr:carboxypeptidase-like regulatory domain-containing protein [Nitrospirota bacterium]MCL5422389.1 carboxypeptidase-like regulatory domain-containing protein [Nitrospirota bacterium]
MKTLISLLLVLFILPTTAGCAISHKYGPYYGKVVDIETKQPIDGAVVLAVFSTEEYGPAGAITRFADAIETTTDKNGEFKIPAYRVTAVRLLQGWDLHPQVRIFKPEYGCYPKHKDAVPKFNYMSLPANQYVTIELPRLKTREERLRNISCFPVGVPDDKMRKLIEVNNIEAINLGLEPSHVQEEKR